MKIIIKDLENLFNSESNEMTINFDEKYIKSHYSWHELAQTLIQNTMAISHLLLFKIHSIQLQIYCQANCFWIH